MSLYWRVLPTSRASAHWTGHKRRHSDEVVATVTRTSEGWRWAVWGQPISRAPLATGLADDIEQAQHDAERALSSLKGAL